jgi:hypothetical protein
MFGRQKFVCSPYFGCLMRTSLAIVANSLLDFTSFGCQATGRLTKIKCQLMMSEIFLKPTVVITNEIQRNKTNRILIKSIEYGLHIQFNYV